MPDTPREALEARWTRLGIREEDLVPASNGRFTATATADHALALPVPGAKRADDATADAPWPAPAGPHELEAQTFEPADRVVVKGLLGAGGMGVVFLAKQPALRRDVAVKGLQSQHKSGPIVSALLREAWVMGTLEHPNIPPVHLLLREDDGSPRVVMKRIEGVAWDELIEEPERLAAHGAESDALEFHLRVLIAVCHAVHFAHSRGILHLDLKPDNVMVGRFGEVQVVDWGIAMGDGERGPPWLPASRTLRGIVGTPAWLAPELAGAEAEHVTARTDVYLLGGILHAILTGTPRHRAEDLKALLVRAYESAPFAYPGEVPAELSGLANRATARDPSARPGSAEAFRAEIEAFLAHRASIRLSDEADKILGPLLARLGRLAQPSAGDDAGAAEGTKADQSLRREFLECQFAYRQALDTWPDNPAARAGLQRLLRTMFEHALRLRQLERAGECLHALPGGDPELARRLSEAEHDAAAAEARRLALERDADPNLHRRTRAKLALACGLTFIVWNGIAGFLHREKIVSLELVDLVWFDAMTSLVAAVVALSVRKSLLRTAFNRRLVILFGGGFVAVFVLWIAAWQLSLVRPELGLTVNDVVSLSSMIYVYFVVGLTFMMDAVIAWLAIPAAVLAALAPRASEYAFELLGLGGGMIGFALALIWWRPRSASASARAQDAARPG